MRLEGVYFSRGLHVSPAGPLCLLALAAAPAAADVVLLHNGVRLEGLVREGDSELTVQVSADGWVVLDPDRVLGIERGGPRDNERLRAAWREGERLVREQEKRDLEERLFVQRQREKGLTLHEGEWLTASQMGLRLERERLELERLRLSRPPAPPVLIQILPPPPIYVEAVFSVAPRLARRGHRRRAAAQAAAYAPTPTFTSSGLLRQPWALPRDVASPLDFSLMAGR